MLTALRSLRLLNIRHFHLKRLFIARNVSLWRTKRGTNQRLYAGIFMALFQCVLLKSDNKRPTSYSKSQQVCKSKEEKPLTETSSNFTVNADILHEHGSAEEQYSYVDLQNFKDSQDPELLLRFGRVCYCIYTYSSATKMKTAVIMNGLKAVERAIQLDSQNADAFVVGLTFNV